jgi:hypothetical protein
MSALGGFDLVIEFARPALRRHFRNIIIGGTAIRAPFDLVVPFRRRGLPGEGNALLRVDSVNLVLSVGTDRMGLSCFFTSSSVDFRGVYVPGLDGSFDISFPWRIVNPPPSGLGNRSFAFLQPDLSDAEVSLHLSRDSIQSLSQTISSSNVNVSVQEIEDRLTDSLKTLARKGVPTRYPRALGIPIDPTVDATIPIPLQPLLGPQAAHLPSLDVVQSVDSETVAVFGRLLLRTPFGNPGAKTSGSTDGWDVAVSISEEAFRRLIFCRNLAIRAFPNEDGTPRTDASEQWLKEAVPALPSCCGAASQVPFSKAILKSICCFFRDGYIETNGSFKKTGFCYEAVGTFNQRTTVSIDPVPTNGGMTRRLVLHPGEIEHEEQVRVPWFCETVPRGSLFLDYGTFGAISMINGDILSNFVKPDISIPAPTDAPLLPFENVSFQDIQITPEALTLRGRWDLHGEIFGALPGGHGRELSIVGGVTSSNPVQIGTGSAHVGGVVCPETDFGWTEFSQQQSANYSVIARGWAGKLTYEWFLEHYRGYIGSVSIPRRMTSSVALPPEGDRITLPVDVHFDAPPPSGITLTDQQVTLEMTERPGEILGLSNWRHQIGHPESRVPGSYSLTLRVRVTDQDGVRGEASTSFRIQGEYVKMDVGYDEFMADCIHSAWVEVSKLSYEAAPIPRDGDPGPGGIVRLIERIYVSDAENSEEIVTALMEDGRRRFGREFDRALISFAFEPSSLAELSRPELETP